MRIVWIVRCVFISGEIGVGSRTVVLVGNEGVSVAFEDGEDDKGSDGPATGSERAREGNSALGEVDPSPRPRNATAAAFAPDFESIALG